LLINARIRSFHLDFDQLRRSGILRRSRELVRPRQSFTIRMDRFPEGPPRARLVTE
jgi:hypothetical protein